MDYYWRCGPVKAMPMTIDEYRKRCEEDHTLPLYVHANPGDPGYLVEDYTNPCNPQHRDWDSPAGWYPKRIFDAMFAPYTVTTEFKNKNTGRVFCGVRLDDTDSIEEMCARIACIPPAGVITPIKCEYRDGMLGVEFVRYHVRWDSIPRVIRVEAPAPVGKEYGGLWLLRDLYENTFSMRSGSWLDREHTRVTHTKLNQTVG